MKTTVQITLRGEEMVTMEVDHSDDEDPTDITRDDARRARKLAGVDSTWDIAHVEVVRK